MAIKSKKETPDASANDLTRLATEQQNTASANLDTKSALEIAQIINREDAKVSAAVKKALPSIAKAIDAIVHALNNGGRLIYVGAGTSGRIAAIDASECPPTFNADPRTVQYVMAGGPRALANAAEFNEDSAEMGAADIAKRRPTRNDVVVGIAASGRTPYTISAIKYAKSRGAATVGISCNPNSELGRVADIEIEVDVGAEVISGSTRMKAGTAQKLVCNMLTTGAFTRLGYVYGNLMVNVHLKNKKLLERGINILRKAAHVDRDAAERALKQAGNHVQVALVMLKTGKDAAYSERILKEARGNVRRAIEEIA